VLRNEKLLDDATPDQVLIHDSLEGRGIAAAVPRSLGIDNGYRSPLADAQAIGLGSKDASLLGEAKLTEAPFQKLPRCETALTIAALRIGLITAEKNVALRDRDANAIRNSLLGHDHLPGETDG